MGSAPLLVVVGPTASGKTPFAVRVAEESDGEVIGADSVQIYKHFDIGSGKPTAEERARVPHHLIDIVDPLEPMDAARWVKLADRAIADIRARGKRPVICGGTFLWVRSLVWGLSEAPAADPAIRARHREIAEREGRAALHAELARVDPAIAEKLAPNDFVRVSRALEVFELTKTPMSTWQALHGLREQRYEADLVGIDYPRLELDRRILARIDAMLDAGWIDEVRALVDKGYKDARAMRSVGYRQIADALASGAPLDLPALRDAIYRATRIFARRQRTWLRDREIDWITPGEAAGARR